MAMKRETGSKDSEIWLLGDSNPRNWDAALETPLDPRHPARHSIWTPILDIIQDRVFRSARLRIDTQPIYIRNAIEDPSQKPKSNQKIWPSLVKSEVQAYREHLHTHLTKFTFAFGAFAYEFARRSTDEKPIRAYSYWGARHLGEAFRRKVQDFDLARINVFPLLHVSIARRRFIKSHDYFCDREGANYFEYVGEAISGLLIDHSSLLRIWIT